MCVKKDVFDKIGGFNEKLGYISEDTEFIYTAIKNFKYRAFYKHDLVVFHKRREFPFQYIKQRFRYRIKNGKLLFVYPEIYMKNFKLVLFLIAGMMFIVSFFVAPAIFWILLMLYMVLVTAEAAQYLRSEPRLSCALIFAFPIHHLTYFLGIIFGLINGVLTRRGMMDLRRD
jgi:GT2 family glycosyltransferase